MSQESGKNKILWRVAIFIIILLSIIVMAFIYHEFIQVKKVDNVSKSIPVETKDVAANSKESTSNATISETQQTKSIPVETKDVAANSQELTSNVPVPKTQSVKKK
jgi:predicted Holliday junction resolvase-like endonuclease